MQTYRTYKIVLWGLVVLSVLALAASVAVMTGVTEPYIARRSPPQLLPVILGGIIVIAASGVGIRFVDVWLWEAIGRQVNLTPEENGMHQSRLTHKDDATIGKAVLTGRIRGRTVRARVQTVKTKGRGSENSSRSKTYTLVGADLRGEVNEGAIVSRGDRPVGSRLSINRETTIRGQYGDLTEIEDPPYFAQTNAESLTRAVLSGRARNDLDEVESFGLFLIGNSQAVYEEMLSASLSSLDESMPEIGEFSLGSMLPSAGELAAGLDRGDSATVTHQVEDVIREPDELERQVQAVVAVADAFDRAWAEREAG